jgi:hypothetical protein
MQEQEHKSTPAPRHSDWLRSTSPLYTLLGKLSILPRASPGCHENVCVRLYLPSPTTLSFVDLMHVHSLHLPHYPTLGPFTRQDSRRMLPPSLATQYTSFCTLRRSAYPILPLPSLWTAVLAILPRWPFRGSRGTTNNKLPLLRSLLESALRP